MSQIEHDASTNEADECNGTSVLNEIILNHADEIEKNSLKNQSKISNRTGPLMNTTFSMHHSKHCFEKFKVNLFEMNILVIFQPVAKNWYDMLAEEVVRKGPFSCG